ncbi:MAG: RIP metalloprotease RseP [Gemmatimonadetes bacterium]|nr:RIP metalloprotease RseP [Gemmatimonadota bacterium]
MLLTLGATILVIGVLIFVHELGHFMAAKSVGIGVSRFSLGLGPVIKPLSFRRGETEYVVSWIPFGGYVKMASKEEQEEVAGSLEGGAAGEVFPPEKLFESKPLWARIFVLSAGVAMNFLFAWVVYVFINVAFPRIEDPTTTIARIDAERLPAEAKELTDLPANTEILRINGDTITSWNDVRDRILDPTSDQLSFQFAGARPVILPIDGFAMDDRVGVYQALVPRREPRISQVGQGTRAEAAGFQVDDLVIRGNGQAIDYWLQMQELIRANPDQTIDFVVRRNGAEVALTAVPDETTVRDPATGEEEIVGFLGVSPVIREVRLGFGASVGEGGRQVIADAHLILATLSGLIRGRLSPRELGGPVLIGQISGAVARQGLIPLLAFMALFSVNLAILNLLPIPVLDGGQLVFLLVEGVRGKPLPLELRLRFSQFGLIILLGIMALALTNDLLRVFSF